MPSKQRSVLVSGGAGFIGSNIVDRLVQEEYDVGVVDNLATGNIMNISKHISDGKVKFYDCDISQYEKIAVHVKGYDAIIHEAALVSVSRSVENPELTNRANVTGTVNLLKAAVDSGVKKFVYASSSSVYGDTETLPKLESMNPSPISPYGVSKLAAENYCKAFARVYGLATVSLRYFNVYGPRQKYGPYSGVIPIFIKRALNNEPPIVNGNGEQTRDFTFVEDVVEANMLALKNEVAPGEVYNVARGMTVSINDLARHILNLTGRKNLAPVRGPERTGDIRASYADVRKISRDLGYKPSVDIETGLRLVLEWFRAGNKSEWE